MNAHFQEHQHVIGTRENSECKCLSDVFSKVLKVLLVDDDRTCLAILERMLRVCRYEVTKCGLASDALSMLREDKNRFDLVVSDLHMPDMDGLELLEIIGIEMEVPVVIMSSDEEFNAVFKGVVHGACDYLIKPVRMDDIKFLWQHVCRKRMNASMGLKRLQRDEEAELNPSKSDSVNAVFSRTGEIGRVLKRRRDDEDERDHSGSDGAAKGKKRLVWTKELHEKFVEAFKRLGPENAVPAKILEMMQRMNVPLITRENVASHLQKYRKYLRNMEEFQLHNHERLASSGPLRMAGYDQSSSANRFNAQMRATQSYLSPVHSLTSLEANGLVALGATSSMAGPFNDQRNLLYSAVKDANYYSETPAADFSINDSSGVAQSWSLVSPFGVGSIDKEHEYVRPKNVVYHSQNLPMVSCEMNDDSNSQLIYDPSLHVQQFDQNDILQGLLMEAQQGVLQVDYNSDWPSDNNC